MLIALFVILALAILAGAHYFLYFSAVHFFQIAGFYKNVLAAIFVFLAVSFILALILAHWQENFFTRSFYLASGFWLGLLVNFILASVVVWLIIFAFRNANAAVLACVFFVLAFFCSVYGAWLAFNPQIKDISVTIPNLPAEWKNKKIVQISDVHLGIVYRRDFMQKVVEMTNFVNPEMVVITGDLFDGMDKNLNFLASPLDELKAEKGVFFVTGNHETYLGIDKVFAALEKTKVKVLKNEVVDVDGLKIIGLNYGDDGIFESLKKDFSGSPNILLRHSPTNINLFKNSGVNLQLSGHTHQGQIFPFGLLTKLIYHGYDYSLHRIGDYTIYTTSGAGTWGPAMRRPGGASEIVVIHLR